MKVLAVLPLVALAAGSVRAEAPLDPNGDRVVVTATRMAQTTDQTLVPVSVLTRDDIERSPATTLPELLGQLPGVDITVSGGHGKTASLFLRGTNSNHTLVLVNGIKIGSATLGSTPLEDIPLHLVERIEVVRGPRSSLYGSAAIGGVVQIFTRKPTAGVSTHAALGAGNHDTQDLSAGIGVGSSIGMLTLDASYEKTDGIDARDDTRPDKDGYENTSMALGYRVDFSDAVAIDVTWLRTQADNQYDGFSGDYNDREEKLQQTLGLALSADLNDDWALSTGISQHRDESDNFFIDWMTLLPTQSRFDTERYSAYGKSDLFISDTQILTLGLDYQKDKVDGTDDFAVKERDVTSVFGQWQGEYGQLGVLAGLRQDDIQDYGKKHTGNLNFGYQLDEQRRVLASFGTAFKAPSFNELYYPFDGFFQGNPDIKAEKSKTVEAGYEVTASHWNYSAKAFVTRIDNLIDWVSDGCFPCMPVNVQRAEIKGLELESRFAVDEWRATANFTVLDPRDRDSDKILTDRSRRTLQLELARSVNALTYFIGLKAQSERYDDKANAVKLPGYAVVNLKGRYDFAPHWAFEAKVNNLWDKKYETNKGYNSLDRTFLLSLAYQH